MPDLIPYPPALSHPGLAGLRLSLPAPSPPLPTSLGLALPPPEFLRIAARLGELYELVFPDRPGWREEFVDWVDESDAVAAINRFLQAVGDLFPVQEMIWEEELEWMEHWLYEIPVAPHGFDLWHEGWDEFAEPIPYLLQLVHGRDGGLDPDNDPRYAPYPVPADLAPARLVESLRERGLSPPLDALPDLIQMLTHSTGNAWLDVGEIGLMEGGGYPTWNRDDVTWLQDIWREAEPILDRVIALLCRRGDDSAATLTAVHAALLRAYHGAGNASAAQLPLPL